MQLSVGRTQVIPGTQVGAFSEMKDLLNSSEPAAANQFFVKYLRQLEKFEKCSAFQPDLHRG